QACEEQHEGAVQTVLANLRHLKYFVLYVEYSEYTLDFSPEALVAPSSDTTPGDLLRPNFACQGLKLLKALSYTFESSDALLPFAHLLELEALANSYRRTKLESLQSVMGLDSPSGAPLKTFSRLENLVISRILQYRHVNPEQKYEEFVAPLVLFPALLCGTISTMFASTIRMLSEHLSKFDFR
ncbi:hypothetical protein EV182_003813, partial [Spiromyces aspiralis]